MKKLDFEYELNKTYEIDPAIIKQLSSFLGELTKADDYQIKEDTVINSIIMQRVLMDFQEVDANYHKYKTFITQRFPGVVNDDA